MGMNILSPFLTLEFPMHVHVSVFSHTIANRPVA